MNAKIKTVNILEAAPSLLFFEKIFVLENEDIACPGAMVVILTR